VNTIERAKRILSHTKEALAFTLALGLGGVAVTACGNEASASNGVVLQANGSKPSDLKFVEEVVRLHLPWGNSGDKVADGDATRLVLPDGEVVDVTIFEQDFNDANNVVPKPANVGEVDVAVYPRGTTNNPEAVPKYDYLFSQGTSSGPNSSWDPSTFVANYTDYTEVSTPVYELRGEPSHGTIVSGSQVTTYVNGSQLKREHNNVLASHTDRNLEQRALQILEDATHHRNIPQRLEDN